MSVSRERFEQGLTYAEYRAQMTRNQERFDEVERSVQLPAEEVAYFKALPQALNVLVLAEDWCGDVIANLPVLGRLAEESGKVNVRVFLRDQNLDIMDQYLKEGQFRSIPVFVLFDEAFRELGHWIERPAAMTALTQAKRLEIFANDPELAGFAPSTPPSELPEEARLRLSTEMSAFRAEKRNFSDSEVVREVRELMSGKAQGQGASAAVSAIPLATNGKAAWQQATRPPAEHPIKVSITYCAECGYEPQTLSLTSALMMEFRGDLASIEIIPWHEGTFDVAVDGEIVHAMMRDGGFPEDATIINAVRSRLGVAQRG